MPQPTHVSTGVPGLDRVVDGLRLGDNVVWQVDCVEDYRRPVEEFVDQALADGRRVIYVRFGAHPELTSRPGVHVERVDPGLGFEAFATRIHHLVAREGLHVFYVFDCLTELLDHWHSDLMVMNFFRVSCPWLFELETVAYFAILRNQHTWTTVAGIRETTQLLLDLYLIEDTIYIHPLKVEDRYSPTMYFPHRIAGDEAYSITASGTTARLFASLKRKVDPPDRWAVLLDAGREALARPVEEQEETRELIMSLLIGRDTPMVDLCRRHLGLADLLHIADREIGTGYVGGKTVGMLIARAILEDDPEDRFEARMEPHDSYFLGSDLFYTFIVGNQWWRLWSEHKTPEGYLTAAATLREQIPKGRFRPSVSELFMRMLEYFGQSPIIVRSSSLLEDNFGNAFAGKYESVFCANQGSPEERLQAFEDAVRTVYASAVSEEALTYRVNRGLVERDEQMAVLVQRVSGDHYGDMFFPQAAGVANSSNLYVWDPGTDPSAGMARLVLGLGTRAVDRTLQDHARIVALDNPRRKSLVDAEDEARYSQRYVDVLSLSTNKLSTVSFSTIRPQMDSAQLDLFATPDHRRALHLQEVGRRKRFGPTPMILDFHGMLTRTDFPQYLRAALQRLEAAYDYPVDVEFTVNVGSDGWRLNLVQCRPLQTRGLGRAVAFPRVDPDDCLIATSGNFMGGNVRLPLEYVVLVRAKPYLGLGQRDRYAVAREIGLLNTILKNKGFMLIAPGRWGTTTPSLGVPVSFVEVCNASVLCEVTYSAGNFLPELSYGSHFFQDLVESGIFYVAVFDGLLGNTFHPDRIVSCENQLPVLDPGGSDLADVIHVARFSDLELFSDVVTQRLVCVERVAERT